MLQNKLRNHLCFLPRPLRPVSVFSDLKASEISCLVKSLLMPSNQIIYLLIWKNKVHLIRDYSFVNESVCYFFNISSWSLMSVLEGRSARADVTTLKSNKCVQCNAPVPVDSRAM